MNGKSSEFLTPVLKCTSSFTPPRQRGLEKNKSDVGYKARTKLLFQKYGLNKSTLV